MRFKTIILFLLFSVAYINTKAQDSASAPVVSFEYVEKLLQPKNNDTTYVINFWATWCKPCVAELPYITDLEKKFADKKIKVYIVSLDFKKYHDKMLAFLKKKGITTSAVLLSDPDANAWINKVDERWSGSIPATVIFNNTKHSFYEKEFHEAELYKIVETFF